jgi:hypothetical protein
LTPDDVEAKQDYLLKQEAEDDEVNGGCMDVFVDFGSLKQNKVSKNFAFCHFVNYSSAAIMKLKDTCKKKEK